MKPLKRYDIFCIVLLFTLTFILFFSNAKAETSLVEKQYKHSLSDNVSSNLDYIIQNSKGGIGSGFFAQASQDENSAGDESSQGNESAGDVDLEIIAKKSANPLGDLWMIWIQNDFSILEGDLLDNLINAETRRFLPWWKLFESLQEISDINLCWDQEENMVNQPIIICV